MAELSRIIPRTFLGKPLYLGARIFGFLMLIIMIIYIVSAIAQFMFLHHRNMLDIKTNVGRNTYGLVIMSIIYCGFMLAVTIWFIIGGLFQEMASVVIGFVALTFLWLVMTLCYLIILISLYAMTHSLVIWVTVLVLGLVAIGILSYGLLVVVGYWYELKEEM